MNSLITFTAIALTIMNITPSSRTMSNNPKPSFWKRLFFCSLSNTTNERTTNSSVSSLSSASATSTREGFTQMTPKLIKAASDSNTKPIETSILPQERHRDGYGKMPK